jgi:hypothetical protein
VLAGHTKSFLRATVERVTWVGVDTAGTTASATR